MYEESLPALGSVQFYRRWLANDVSQVIQLPPQHVITAHVPTAE